MKGETKQPSAVQLGLELPPQEPFSLGYLVPHSGIAEALEVLQTAVHEAAADPHVFSSVYIYGPQGSGKTYLLQAYAAAARAAGIKDQQVRVFDFDGQSIPEEQVSSFVSEFERIKRSGGVLFAAGRYSPDGMTINEHVISRLRCCALAALRYPPEEELRPLLSSLSERRNLRLSERTMSYLIRRLPANPLSFDAIFASIDQLCIAQGKPARLGIIQEVIKEGTSGSDAQGPK